MYNQTPQIKQEKKTKKHRKSTRDNSRPNQLRQEKQAHVRAPFAKHQSVVNGFNGDIFEREKKETTAGKQER